jgi:hypothetical protein
MAGPDPATHEWWGGQPGHPVPIAGSTGGTRRRSRGAVVAAVAVILVVLVAAAGAAYVARHRIGGTGPSAPAGSATAGTGGSPTPSPPASSGTPAATAVPPPPGVLAATVRAYYAAINHHRYFRAWRLGGRNTGETYPAFVSGFAGTAHDGVTIQSVSGHVVTAQVVAEQTDGTVKTYQGTYTVADGVITQFDVHRVS